VCHGGYFYGTQVPKTQQTRVSQTRVLKRW